MAPSAIVVILTTSDWLTNQILLEWEGNLPFFMERDKLKLIVRNLKLLVEALESEVFSDVDAYKTEETSANYITDYDEVFYDDDGYPD